MGLPATAGRVAGTTIKGLLWAHRTTDWDEAWAIVLHGLQILIVLTLLAGRASTMLRFKTDQPLPASLAGQARVTGRIVQVTAHDAAEVETTLGSLRAAGVPADDASTEFEAARARVEAATSALELQRQSYEGERARFAAGQSDLPRVLQAQASLDAAQLAWVQSHLDARAASAKVARLDGSILTRHGFTMDTVEQKVGAGLGAADRLRTLTTTP